MTRLVWKPSCMMLASSATEASTMPGPPRAFKATARDAEVLAFEAGFQEYCEREVDEVSGRVYLHLGVRRDDLQQR
jgi:hypothetical protein